MSSVLERQNEAAMLHGPCCYFLKLRSEALQKQGRLSASSSTSSYNAAPMRQAAPRSQNNNNFQQENSYAAPPVRESRNAAPSTMAVPIPAANPLGVIDVNSQKLPTPGSIDVEFDKANEQPTFTGPQVECPYCYRSFNGDRVERHVVACKKTHDKKSQRKEFDAKGLRVKQLYEDTTVNADDVLRKIDNGAYDKKPAKKKDWRKESEKFQKMVRGEELEPEADERVPCPGCGRKFASDAADRHIPKCLERYRR